MVASSQLSRPLALAAILAAAFAGRASAHVGHHAHPASLTAWRVDPEIMLAAALALWIRVRGALRRRTGVQSWRLAAFVAGVACVLVALELPVDPMAERLFWMHQVQHMLLRIAGPLLIALSIPRGEMVSGLPRAVRRGALAPMLRSRRLGAFWHWLNRPAPLFAMYVASLYIWQVPALHDLALVNEPVHYLMHVTMLAAGVVFWSAMLDPRDPPKAIGHRTREVILIGTILSNMLLGSFTTLKAVVLYPAYDIQGRLFDMAPMADEAAGGFLIWAPSSMMSLIGMMLVMNLWNRAEETRLRRFRSGALRSNSAALEFPETAEELRLATTAVNLRTGRLLGLLSATMFVIVFSMAVMAHALH